MKPPTMKSPHAFFIGRKAIFAACSVLLAFPALGHAGSHAELEQRLHQAFTSKGREAQSSSFDVSFSLEEKPTRKQDPKTKIQIQLAIDARAMSQDGQSTGVVSEGRVRVRRLHGVTADRAFNLREPAILEWKMNKDTIYIRVVSLSSDVLPWATRMYPQLVDRALGQWVEIPLGQDGWMMVPQLGSSELSLWRAFHSQQIPFSLWRVKSIEKRWRDEVTGDAWLRVRAVLNPRLMDWLLARAMQAVDTKSPTGKERMRSLNTVWTRARRILSQASFAITWNESRGELGRCEMGFSIQEPLTKIRSSGNNRSIRAVGTQFIRMDLGGAWSHESAKAISFPENPLTISQIQKLVP